MIFTNISLSKLVDTPVVGDKMPSHAIVASDDKYENKTTVGKLWMKEYNGTKYLSGGLNKENRKYQKKDGTQGEEKEYVVISRDDYNELVASKSNQGQEVQGAGFNGAVEDISAIDF